MGEFPKDNIEKIISPLEFAHKLIFYLDNSVKKSEIIEAYNNGEELYFSLFADGSVYVGLKDYPRVKKSVKVAVLKYSSEGVEGISDNLKSLINAENQEVNLSDYTEIFASKLKDFLDSKNSGRIN